jgi:hypothetical protein
VGRTSDAQVERVKGLVAAEKSRKKDDKQRRGAKKASRKDFF